MNEQLKRECETFIKRTNCVFQTVIATIDGCSTIHRGILTTCMKRTDGSIITSTSRLFDLMEMSSIEDVAEKNLRDLMTYAFTFAYNSETENVQATTVEADDQSKKEGAINKIDNAESSMSLLKDTTDEATVAVEETAQENTPLEVTKDKGEDNAEENSEISPTPTVSDENGKKTGAGSLDIETAKNVILTLKDTEAARKKVKDSDLEKYVGKPLNALLKEYPSFITLFARRAGTSKSLVSKEVEDAAVLLFTEGLCKFF